MRRRKGSNNWPPTLFMAVCEWVASLSMFFFITRDASHGCFIFHLIIPSNRLQILSWTKATRPQRRYYNRSTFPSQLEGNMSNTRTTNCKCCWLICMFSWFLPTRHDTTLVGWLDDRIPSTCWRLCVLHKWSLLLDKANLVNWKVLVRSSTELVNKLWDHQGVGPPA